MTILSRFQNTRSCQDCIKVVIKLCDKVVATLSQPCNNLNKRLCQGCDKVHCGNLVTKLTRL